MGCSGVHPPWFCKAFEKMPAKERERLITDKRLCQFCLLHDRDKQCGAKERTVSVACTTASCKGRHIQKLHDLLKDVFREERLVHMIYGAAEWEESDEAWELGEEEMIVGTVRQEDDHSWQDTCDAWTGQSEEVSESRGQQAPDQGTKGQHDGTEAMRGTEEIAELEGLLLEGEEQEYFLELLMRKASPEQPMEALVTRGKMAPTKGRKGLRKEKGGLRGEALKKATEEEVKEGAASGSASSQKEQVAPDLNGHPEAKGRGVAVGDQEERECSTGAQQTSGGECSRQKMAGYS